MFCVQCRYTGTSNPRPYTPIEGLTAPSLERWNKKTKRFEGRLTSTDVANNDVLEKLTERCDKLLSNPRITTPSEFITALKTGTAPSEVLTLAEFVKTLKDEEQQNATKNYQLYLTLLHNLKGENHKHQKGEVSKFPKPTYNGRSLAETPLSEIGDAHLFTFANWIKTEKGGANYKNLNATLHHVIAVASQRGLNLQRITYKFRKDAPKKATVNTEVEKVLTAEQFSAITALCGTEVNPTGYRNKAVQQLYLDTALLMYYTLSRPADVILFRSDMISTTEKGTKVLRYIPYKKRNYPNATAHTVCVPLNNEAIRIIEKYSGQSLGGYILPLPLNQTKWDITTVDGNDKWRIASNTVLGNINAHLKKVGAKVGLAFPLTLYAFRRSTISHAINRGDNSNRVAKRAGTSLKMIDQHYYKDTEI